MHFLLNCTLGLWLLCLCASASYSQHPYEFKVTSENDNYCLQLHDGYYTNGLFLTVNYVPNRLNSRILPTDKLTKITSYYQLGQMIFTPGFISSTLSADLIDRPFAGYLFAEKGMTFFYKKGHVLKTALSVGTVGPNSLAREAQLFIHNTFDLQRPRGWNYQVKNELGATISGQYWHEFIPETRRRKWFDIHGTTQLTIGNTSSNASAGLLLQAGYFSRPDQSSLFDARVDRKVASHRKTKELYAFWYPSYQYQLYNATVQGRLFSDNSGSILSPLDHWVYRHDIGAAYAQSRWTFRIAYTFKQREATNMRQNEQYVGLTTAYRFGD